MTTEQIAALTREDFHRMAGELKPETRMFIDGRFVNANSSRQFKTINPANDEVIASMPLGGPEDVDLAVAAARKAFKRASGPGWNRVREPRWCTALPVPDCLKPPQGRVRDKCPETPLTVSQTRSVWINLD